MTEYQDLLRESTYTFTISQISLEDDRTLCEEARRYWVDFPLQLTLRMSPPPRVEFDYYQKTWQSLLPNSKLTIRITQNGQVVPHIKSYIAGEGGGQLVGELEVNEAEHFCSIQSATSISIDPRYYGTRLQLEFTLQLLVTQTVSFTRKLSANPLESELRRLVDAAYHGLPISPERMWSQQVIFFHPIRVTWRVDELDSNTTLLSVSLHNIDHRRRVKIIRANLDIHQSKIDTERFTETLMPQADENVEMASMTELSLTSSSTANAPTGGTLSPAGQMNSILSRLRATPLINPTNCDISPGHSKVFVYRLQTDLEALMAVWPQDAFQYIMNHGPLGFYLTPFHFSWRAAVGGEESSKIWPIHQRVLSWSSGTKKVTQMNSISSTPSPFELLAMTAQQSSAAFVNGTDLKQLAILRCTIHCSSVVEVMKEFTVTLEIVNSGHYDIAEVVMSTSRLDATSYHQIRKFLVSKSPNNASDVVTSSTNGVRIDSFRDNAEDEGTHSQAKQLLFRQSVLYLGNIQAKERRRVSLSAIALVTGALVIEGFTLTGTVEALAFAEPVAIGNNNNNNNNTNSTKGSVLLSQKASMSGISIANASLKTSSVSKKSPQAAKSRMLCYDMVMPVEILSVSGSGV